MIARIAKHIGSLRLAARERGGIALIMLIGFIGLAVPITIASVQTSAQLSRNSRIYDARLTGMYNAGAGVEAAIHEILSDPNFDDDLTPSNPDKTINVDINSETVNVTVTKIYPSGLQGQGLVLGKAVTPTSTPASVPTTFTYTITLKNEGQDTVTLEQVRDYLPPGMVYDSFSTTGFTTLEPVVDNGPTIDTDYWYLSSGNGPPPTPWTWDTSQGSNQDEASYTPAVNSWETLPDSWESAPFATGGLIPSTTWSHRQRFNTATGGNKWRFRVQRVRGGVPTDMFTSASDNAPTFWSYDTISHSAPGFTVQAGDTLRLRLEVWSPDNDPAKRLFQYRWGGFTGYQSRTTVPLLFVGDCNDDPQRLTWDLAPYEQVEFDEELTLSFTATTALADNSTYYNQASVRYDPWWVSSDVTVWTPYTAPIIVGSGATKCGYDMDVLVTKDVEPPDAPPGESTEFTYTITIENTDSTTRRICRIEDLLPPAYTYVTGSAADYPGNIDTSDPSESWQSSPERWRLRWSNGESPLITLAPGATSTQVFRANATPEPGVNYFNEVNANHTTDSECDEGGGTGQGGAGNSSKTTAPPVYDVQAIASDGTVLSRVLFWDSEGEVEILSWQQD